MKMIQKKKRWVMFISLFILLLCTVGCMKSTQLKTILTEYDHITSEIKTGHGTNKIVIDGGQSLGKTTSASVSNNYIPNDEYLLEDVFQEFQTIFLENDWIDISTTNSSDESILLKKIIEQKTYNAFIAITDDDDLIRIRISER